MKKWIIAFVLACVSLPSVADTYVRGYVRDNGTYVQPHYKTNSDSTMSNNYSTQGNVNPYTGQPGTVPNYDKGYNDYNSQQPSYQNQGYGSQYRR